MSYRRGYSSGGSRGFNRGFTPKPVQVGKEYDVDVTEISRQRDGIARVQGFVIFVPSRKTIETTDGKIVASRDNPRDAFEGHVTETPWDNLHLVYFTGYAMWTYLTSPFLLKLPNVRREEIEPW